jgi:o-succinylbenzoate---CoA ligase
MSATDRSLVAVQLPPTEAASVIAGVWEGGGAVLPLDPTLSFAVAEERARACRASALVHPGGTTGLPGGAGSLDLGAVLFTSGTTGAPKAVELTTAALERAARMTNEALGASPGDRWLCCLPLHHIAGLGILARARVLGAPPLVLERFDVAEVAVAEAELVSLVPTALARLLDAGVDVARFKAVLLGGAAIPAGLVERAEERGARVVRSYGMTETCGGVVYDGVPLPGVRVRIGGAELPGAASSGEGTIAISSPTLMRGYRGEPPLDSGWFDTSDLGLIRAGRLEVTGRADDVIVTGGEKVSPTAVEKALLALDGVTDALVAGAPDPEWGQRVVAFVVAPGREPTELIRELRAGLARHEVPKSVVVVDRIPRTDTGKPLAEWVKEQTPG